MSSAVEVRSLETGSYYNATLKEYDPAQQKVLVSFENGWKADEYVPLSLVRSASAPHNPAEFRPAVNDKVEVMAKSSENEPYSFWPAVVKNVRGDFYFISYVAFDEASEILEKDMLRPINNSPVLQASDFNRLEIVLPSSLHNKVKADQFQQLKSNSGVLSITIDDKKHALVVLGSAMSVEKARLLCKMTFKHLEQLVSLQEKTMEKQKQKQELQSRLKNGKLLEFTVDKTLIGLVIGAQGANVKKAEKLPGVLNVRVDTETCLVTILAQTNEACEKARNLLEFVTDSILIPRKDVGRIVGSKGSNIREIEKETHVSRIRVEDHNPSASTSTSASVSSKWADEEDDLGVECSEILITGTRDCVANAKLMVQELIQFVKQSVQLNENFRALSSEVSKLSLEAGNIKQINTNENTESRNNKQRPRKNNNKQNNNAGQTHDSTESSVNTSTTTTAPAAPAAPKQQRRQRRERQAAAAVADQ